MNICNSKFYQRKNVFWKLKDTRYEDYFIFFLNKNILIQIDAFCSFYL